MEDCALAFVSWIAEIAAKTIQNSTCVLHSSAGQQSTKAFEARQTMGNLTVGCAVMANGYAASLGEYAGE